MIFIANIDYFEHDTGDGSDIVALVAEDFVHAMTQIEEAYGKMLNGVQLEPISDSNLIYLDKDTENKIRENPYNEF